MSTAPIQHVNERQGRFAFVDKSTKAESWGKSSFKEGFNINSELRIVQPVSYTHLTLPTIYSV